jgi:hypothetical protein
MTKKIAVAVVHLVLVAFGAAHGRFEGLGWVGKPLGWYAALSGADSEYGFFAPGVGSQLRADFEITGADGRQVSEELIPNLDREVSLRVGNIIGIFWDEIDDEQSRRSIAASWAGTVLARHPGARQVKVVLRAYDLPSMAEYRSGERPQWTPFYQAVFVRRAKS